jgi:hypothetical protein
MKKPYRLGKTKRNVIEQVDVEVMMGLLAKVSSFSSSASTTRSTTPSSKSESRCLPDQMDALMLPCKLWDRRAGWVLPRFHGPLS